MNIERKPFNESYFTPDSTDRGGRERGLDSYEAYLGFVREQLEGKDVLDLGSGETELFSRELKDAGVTANVVSLNPDYSKERYRKKINSIEGWQKKSVAATAQSLPFKDESFDYVFGNHSVTVFASPTVTEFHPEPEGAARIAKQWALEVARVLKPGGEIRLAPIYIKEYETFYKPLKKIWREAGLEFDENIQDMTRGDMGLGDSHVINAEGKRVIEPRDPDESVGFARLVLRKPFKNMEMDKS
ncbi:MAG: class I SAM-dependent methyltransferase [Patescibacteria group bacterium]